MYMYKAILQYHKHYSTIHKLLWAAQLSNQGNTWFKTIEDFLKLLDMIESKKVDIMYIHPVITG